MKNYRAKSIKALVTRQIGLPLRCFSLISMLVALADVSSAAFGQRQDRSSSDQSIHGRIDDSDGNHPSQNGAESQSNATTSIGLTYSDPVAVRWKVGVSISAGAADVGNVYIAIPIPNDWPEQTVMIDSEEMPHSVGKVTYVKLDSGLKRQLIKIPVIKSRDKVEITTTFRVLTSQINAPPETSVFIRPDLKHKAAKGFTAPNQYISFRNSKLRAMVDSLVEDKGTVWKEVEAIYDWVRENIDQKEMPSTDSVKTYLKKEGSEEDKVALFVSMCRYHRIPARMVWVDGGSYAEFMLVDAQDQAHWFPCNLAGLREFGSLSEPRIILQKGEYLKIPEKSDRQKFVAEHMTCQTVTKPIVEFVRELLPADH
jgi:hypothetical protein